MQIVTQEEYDQAVQDVADRVFDPMLDTTFDVDEITGRVLDDCEHRPVVDDVMEHIVATTNLDPPFGDGEWARLPAHVHGCIVEHSGTRYVPESVRRYFDELDVVHPEKTVAQTAHEVFVGDVRSEVFSRIRKSVENEKQRRAAEA